MRNKLIIVQRATASFDSIFAEWPDDSFLFYPGSRRRRIWKGRIHFEVDEETEDLDRFHDPDYLLDKKLESAPFSVLHDAGPPDAAFPAGARITGLELYYMLRHRSIAVDSIFLHNETGRCHRVVSNPRGDLVLVPPCKPT